MRVNVRLVDGGDCLLYTCSGDVTAGDLMEANSRLLKVPERIRNCRYAIVDCTGATTLNVTPEELRQIARQDLRLAAAVQPAFAVAIVAPTDVVFGLSRMWQVMAESTGWVTNVLRTRAEAETWVRRTAKYQASGIRKTAKQ